MNMATDSEKFFLIVARLVFIMQSMQILMRHDPYYLTLFILSRFHSTVPMRTVSNTVFSFFHLR